MPRSKDYDATGIEYHTIPNFTFSTGEQLPITLAYRIHNPSSPHTILIPTCYGGHINNTLNFTTGAFRTYKTIIVAALGNGESSSPSNTTPTGSFPKAIHYLDCVNAQALLLTQHLHITHLTAVLGFSMGGQQAYYWAVLSSLPASPSNHAPALSLRAAICICTSARTSPHNYAFLEGPIAALTTSHDYAGGAYRANGVHPTDGLRAFGRAYAAWLTSPEWFRRRLWTESGRASLREWLFPPEGEGSWEGWDAEDMLVMARMWQAGDVGTLVGGSGNVGERARDDEGEDAFQRALGGVTCKVLVMPSRTDQYFPPEDSEREVGLLKRGRLEVIETVWGHVAGGGGSPVDVEWMDGRIARFLGELEDGE